MSEQKAGGRRFTDADREEAKSRIAEAFALAGLVEGGNFICPACGKVHRSRGTMKVRPTGWYCYSAGEGGDSISLLQDHLGLSFPEAVNTLLGRTANPAEGDPDRKPKRKVRLPKLDADRHKASVDPEVYAAVVALAGADGRAAAAEYYGKWFIHPGAVQESGAVMVTDMPALQKELTSRFGIQRLRDCGLVTEDRKGRDYWLLNDEYPVIEPHWTPKGNLVGMQFRPSYAQLERVRAHLRWVAAKEAGDTSVPEAKYVPKFLSLAGVNPEESLVGCGLHRLAQLPPGTTVVIVEGFKDLLAARTMGQEAYGMPGTSAKIPDRVLNLLRRFRVIVALDGDEAGRAGRDKIIEYLHEAGITAAPASMPEGMDVADILAAKQAAPAA